MKGGGGENIVICTRNELLIFFSIDELTCLVILISRPSRIM